ncbi:MAG: ATP-dependent helicase, partial [Kiritimatiellae bacterium]|nr:ATP-dependent helicase [Kiritimatiellia bacterium]
MIEFSKELNKEQYAAATAPGGPMLVLAAAGTGKTRTLIYRVAYLIDQGVDPHRILLLTFTNKAAREMIERATALTGAGIGGMWGGTFHHIANKLLRRHASALGYESDYTILDSDDSKKLVRHCMSERKLIGREFPKPTVLLSLFSSAANTETPIGAILEECPEDYKIDPKDILLVQKDYIKSKKELGGMDFDDMLVNCLRLLKEKPDITRRYQEQFLHILVDEYQDTNTLQAQIINLIAEKHRNLFVVGDDFQSIYAWRGADFKNIMSFPKFYPDTDMHKLETNYRSVPEILEVANACIAGNPEQFQKTLRATRKPLQRPVTARLRDGEAQARYIAKELKALRNKGHKLSDIAILYRAHFHSMQIQMHLTRERIPYVITSGVRFFEQAHIKDVCCLLKILINPIDKLAFLRLLELLPKVGPKSAEKAWRKLNARFDSGDKEQREQLIGLIRPATRGTWKSIDRIISVFHKENLQCDPGEVIHRFLKAYYEDYLINSYENGKQRLEDIRELILYTGSFENTEKFLSDVALLSNLDTEAANVNRTHTDALRLSTVHQAKGLEWRAVFLLWLTDGMFPSSRSLQETEGGE